MTYLNAIAVLCAASAWLVTRRAPQQRPVAVALSLCAALDIIRGALPLPARVDLAMCLVAPVASRWAYVNAFHYANGSDVADAVGMWAVWAILACIVPRGAWDWIVPVAYVMNPLLGGAAALHRFTVKGIYRVTVTQRTAAMLLAGDVAGLVLLCRREWISYQAGAVLALATAYQAWWLWRLIDAVPRR